METPKEMQNLAVVAGLSPNQNAYLVRWLTRLERN